MIARLATKSKPQQPVGCEDFDEERNAASASIIWILQVVFAFADVPYPQLHIRIAAVVVLHDGVADVERIAGLDVVERAGHIEANRRDVPSRVVLLDELELEVSALGPHLASVAVVVDVLREENRHRVLRAERLELLEDAQELWRNLSETYL